LLILSKYPVAAYDHVTFSNAVYRDKLYAKGAIYAKLRISALDFIHVVVCHLQATYGRDPPRCDIEVRKKQLREINALIRKHVRDTLPIFVFGDFNIDALRGEEYSSFDSELVIPKFERIDTVFQSLRSHPVTYGGVDENGNPTDVVLTVPEDLKAQASLDYIFYFKNTEKDWVVKRVAAEVEKFQVMDRPYKQLSDHYAISATIEVTDL
jgi:endonuclease/exonuclease/phosphatase family metal-dependent hydrolase